MKRQECTLHIAPEPEPILDAPVPVWAGVAFEVLVYAMTGCFLGWIAISW